MRSWRDLLKLLISLAVTYAVAYAGSAYSRPEINTWYAELRKPAFNPPGWVFMPVWTVLYTLMAIAAYLVWQSRVHNRFKVLALSVYLVQLGLNFLWTYLFFAMRQPSYALLNIVALWLMIAITMTLFTRISRVAGLLLVPYLAWVTFAAILNSEIWRLNRP